jgi:DNA-binding beta-propeller fold protein YncE
MSYRIGFLLVVLSCACVLPSSAQSLVTDIVVPGSPSQVAVNPGSNRIYVSLNTSTGPAIGVIDGNTNTYVDTISTPAAGQLAVNLVTGRVYTTDCCNVYVIDVTKDKVIATISVTSSSSIGIQGITVNPVTNRIFVTDDSDFQVVAIDGYTNTIVARDPTQNQELLGMAVDFGTNQILAAASGNQIVAVNGSTGAITRYTVGTINQNVAVNSFTGRAYVTNQGISSTLGLVNLASGKTGNIPLQATPIAVCADYLSNLIFVTVSNQTIAVIDGRTNKQTGRVVVSGNYIDVNPATRLVYASDGVGAQVVHVISE